MRNLLIFLMFVEKINNRRFLINSCISLTDTFHSCTPYDSLRLGGAQYQYLVIYGTVPTNGT
jgi:hypothetical protein